MKNYIERYIFAVKKHLPHDQKEEITSELRTFILEQVNEDDPFEKIEAVLKGLGSPRKLAYSYRDQNRSLIGPEHFELYIDVLKIGMLIIIGVNVALGILGVLNGIFTEGTSLGRLIELFFEEVIGSTVTSALIGFSLITIGFVCAVHFKWFDQNDEWLLKDLPELPKKTLDDGFKARPIIFETIGVSVGVSVLLLILRLPWLAFSEGDNDLTIITPENYTTFFPFFLALVGGYIAIQLIWLRSQRMTSWVFGLRILHSISLITVLAWMFFGSTVFLSPENIETFADIVGVDPHRLNQQINLILAFILFIFIAQMGYDRFKDYRKLKKQTLLTE